jgi:hypothetical protein
MSSKTSAHPSSTQDVKLRVRRLVCTGLVDTQLSLPKAGKGVF